MIAAPETADAAIIPTIIDSHFNIYVLCLLDSTQVHSPLSKVLEDFTFSRPGLAPDPTQ